MTEIPFWERKKLTEMTAEEWESLCDGCGKCCLHKLIDEDDSTDEVHFTHVSCHLLDTGTARCRHYADRKNYVPDCVVISPDNLAVLDYMPPSCAYRRLAEGRGLASWHPLLNGGSQSAMIAAGISAAGRVISEDQLGIDLEDCIVSWPLNDC
ncbi:YcgN family cysteine cluster protein [Pseudidiomarina sp.]|uniref:YcgN family cysteine cluster protein n=1 Tax=Pseudidiomarina sp. TaxID=2081707 RepID=UPI00299D4983|nr:YcgN family cysteine cluster protein [Pseudidiomarina sp.]MDX1705166.1 YcgN family cysteine cluster protein [Pseudidiomarina sp.]